MHNWKLKQVQDTFSRYYCDICNLRSYVMHPDKLQRHILYSSEVSFEMTYADEITCEEFIIKKIIE